MEDLQRALIEEELEPRKVAQNLRVIEQALYMFEGLHPKELGMFDFYFWQTGQDIESERARDYLKAELLKRGWESCFKDTSVRCDLNQCEGCPGWHYYTRVEIWPVDRSKFAKMLTGSCIGATLCCLCNGGCGPKMIFK